MLCCLLHRELDMMGTWPVREHHTISAADLLRRETVQRDCV
jgi:hypothetical protein